MCNKKPLKFQAYKNCLEAAQIDRKINYLRKNKIVEDSLQEDQKDFVKNNKMILKTQQGFKSEKHNVFTEGIDKIALNSNDDRQMRPIDSIDRYAYGTSKDLICKKEKIKRNNIIKQYKNV